MKLYKVYLRVICINRKGRPCVREDVRITFANSAREARAAIEADDRTGFKAVRNAFAGIGYKGRRYEFVCVAIPA